MDFVLPQLRHFEFLPQETHSAHCLWLLFAEASAFISGLLALSLIGLNGWREGTWSCCEITRPLRLEITAKWNFSHHNQAWEKEYLEENLRVLAICA